MITGLGLNIDLEQEVIIIAVPALLNIYAYWLPFWITLFYWVFGAEFVLIRWVDNLLMFLIEHWISNYNVFIMFFGVIIILAAISQETEAGYAVMAFLYAI